MTDFPLYIPLNHHAAILGKPGSGKTVVAKGEVEVQLIDGKRVCILDPTDVWWGLRLMKDGSPSPFKPVIFGGDHSDLPLSPDNGHAIADIVARTDTPVIIATGNMLVSERTKFFTDFAETLYRLNRAPLRLVLDEAHVFMPQTRVNDPNSSRMVHAGNNLVAMGRHRGLSVVMITQRPAKLHKDSLSTVETMVAMRLPSPQDRKAIESWIDDWTDRETAKDVMSSLPSLETGEGWIWTPIDKRLERVMFPMCSTYDSSRAAYFGMAPVALTPIDLTQIRAQIEMAAVDLGDDVVALQARITELERQVIAPRVDEARLRIEGLAQGAEIGFKAAREAIAGFITNHGIEWPGLDRAMESAHATIPELLEGGEPPELSRRTIEARAVTVSRTAELMGPAERKLLGAAVQFPGSQIKKLCLVAGYSHGSGSVAGAMGMLRRRGFITRGSPIMPTDEGVAALGNDFKIIETGPKLIAYWLGKLDKAPATMLQVLISSRPAGLTKAELCKRCGYSPKSGSVSAALAELRTLGLMIGGQSTHLHVSEHLFGG